MKRSLRGFAMLAPLPRKASFRLAPLSRAALFVWLGACGGGASVEPCASGTCVSVEPCAQGTWDHDADHATACVAHTDCVAGESVTAPGTATSDRVCSACPSDTFSTTTNATSCTMWTACEAGTSQTSPGTRTSAPACAPCAAGRYCPGGAAAPTPCGDGELTWDHDADPSTACAPRTTCVPGTYVAAEGDATTDRVCSACDGETFSTVDDAASCSSWTSCEPGLVEGTPPSSTNDRTCVVPTWTRQYGANGSDGAEAVAVDAGGNALVLGSAAASLVGSFCCGPFVTLRKYDPYGAALWTRELTALSGAPLPAAVAVSASGRVFVAGLITGELVAGSSAGGDDAFLTSFDANGGYLWTVQFGSSGSDSASGVAVDPDGNLLVVGTTTGTLPGNTSWGGADGFVRKYDVGGFLLWSRQFGSGDTETITGVAVDASGSVFVVGETSGAIPDQVQAGQGDGFVRKYDTNGTELWTRQFGSPLYDSVSGVAVDANGNVLVSGTTYGSLGPSPIGGGDAFLRKFDSDGNALWTRHVGTTEYDAGNAVAVDGSGHVLLTGVTGGTFPEQTASSVGDAFVCRYDAGGNERWCRQFGSTSGDWGYGIAADEHDAVIVVGRINGTLPDQTSSGGADHFVRKYDAAGNTN